MFGALIGAGIGLLSTAMTGESNKRDLRRQKKIAWEKYLAAKETGDRDFSINRNQALENVALGKQRLTTDLGLGLDQFNLNLEQQAYQIQDAQIQAQGQAGMSRAAEGMSGTRGSNSSELMRLYGLQSLDRNAGIQYEQNDINLAGMLNQANNTNTDLNRERDSWGAGGYRTALKQNQDDYNRKMADMGQAEFDYQIGQQVGFADLGKHLLTGGLGFTQKDMTFFSGAFQGASMGQGLQNSFTNAQQFSSQQPQSFSHVGGANYNWWAIEHGMR